MSSSMARKSLFLFVSAVAVLLTLWPEVSADKLTCYDHGVDGLTAAAPLIIAHRGSSGVLPEHTVAAYQRAVRDGADVIECDVCVTRDLQLVCLHEMALSHTTDVSSHLAYAGSRNTYVIDGKTVTDWFSVDFTLSELRTLKKVQQLSFRDQSYNGMYGIATLEEMIDVAEAADRPIGLHIETKVPTFVNALPIITGASTTMEKLLVDLLTDRGYSRSNQPCFLQSFDESSLQRLSQLTKLPLVMLVGSRDPTPTDQQLMEWSQQGYYGVGTSKTQIIAITPETDNKFTIKDFDYTHNLASKAHGYGLRVHAYTFRNEDRYLAWNYSQDFTLEYDEYMKVGVDGYFTDFPATLYRYLTNIYGDNYREDGKLCKDHTSSGYKTNQSCWAIIIIILFYFAGFNILW